MAAQSNIMDAVAAQIAEIAAPALVQAGVPGEEVVKLVSDFLTNIHEVVEQAKNKAKELGVEMPSPELSADVGEK